MERMSKKFKVPEVETVTKSTISNLSKWIPLLCAGAAAGVSIIALKEIQNVRKELKTKNQGCNEEHAKRLEIMEEQLKNLSEFITNKQNKQNKFVPEKIYHKPPPPKEHVIKNAHTVLPNEVKIVNENFDPDEYEEVEVTDDES